MEIKKKIKENKHIIIGTFFLILQVIAIIRNRFDYENLFWFCNFAPILFAIFFYSKKMQAVKAVISITLIINLFFLADFFSSIFFNYGIFGQVQSYFKEGFLFITATLLMHLTGLIALSLTYKIKPKTKNLSYSALLIAFTYLMTIIFSPRNSYYNYIKGTRPGYFHPNIPYIIITVLWPILMFFIIATSGYYIQYLLYKISKKK